MKRENKISFYDIEDIEKIGKIDNINCNAKNFLNILFESIPFLLILAVFRLLPIAELISNIIAIVIIIIIFLSLFLAHHYNRIINFEFSINGNQIKYKNEQGQIFNYSVSDIIDVKWYHRYSRTGLSGDKIEINMKDTQKICVKSRDKHFYKLVMYLEQNKLLQT